MALIPPIFLDCVVAIGTKDSQSNPGGDNFQCIASGFLYAHYVSQSEKGADLYRIFLVTNRHVFEGLSLVYLRFNPKASEPVRDYNLQLLNEQNSPIWFTHPNDQIDIAVIEINFSRLLEHGMQASCFASNKHSATLDQLKDEGVAEGYAVYVLGFPMGLVGKERNIVIVRKGSIARISNTFNGTTSEFLIDALIFPGNSGSPVILKPEPGFIAGTKPPPQKTYLIGIVTGYLPYEDVAYSLQTKRPRVTFEENSGLGVVHPMDFVKETIDTRFQSEESTTPPEPLPKQK